jgi:hypothetical protein
MLGSDDEDMEDNIESDVDSDDDSDSDKASDDESDDDNASKSGSDSNDGSDNEDNGEDNDEETDESLKTKIADANNAIKAGRERLSEVRKEKKDAIDGLAGLKKKHAKAQKEKNAFCSLKRSEVRYYRLACISQTHRAFRSSLAMFSRKTSGLV